MGQSSLLLRVVNAGVCAFAALLTCAVQTSAQTYATDAVAAYINSWASEQNITFVETPTIRVGHDGMIFEGVTTRTDGVSGTVEMVFSADGTAMQREESRFADGSYIETVCEPTGTCISEELAADGTFTVSTIVNGVVVRMEITYADGQTEVYILLADGSFVNEAEYAAAGGENGDGDPLTEPLTGEEDEGNGKALGQDKDNLPGKGLGRDNPNKP